MKGQIILEIAGIAAGTMTGVFALIRYLVSQNNKRDKNIFEFFSQQQKTQNDFYEKKNGYNERMAINFADNTRDISVRHEQMHKEMSASLKEIGDKNNEALKDFARTMERTIDFMQKK